MTLEDMLQMADEAMSICFGDPLTDIQRMILRESLAGKGYAGMEGYALQHIKNEGKKLWDLLSEALGETVSKTNFKGALEKRLQSTGLALKPPTFPAYNPQTWVGREVLVEDLLAKLQDQTRLLWITGISGVGKTTLGECLASQAWEQDPSFQWIYLEVLEGQSADFTTIAAELLAKLGDKELDSQERNDPKRLTERLIRKLQTHRYWIQLDSLERLLNSTEFTDPYWLTFLQRCLTESNFSSRFVFTAQVLPSALAELSDRYPNHWHKITLKGLTANEQHNEHLDLFNKNGITVDESNQSILQRIGQIYEGHPLVLQVIAKEVIAAPFNGNVATYWQRYSNEFEQVARELQTEHVNPAIYSQALQRQVRRRVEISLKRLPTDALALLCRSSVYRRPVPETFWLAMISDRSPAQQQEAYLVLGDRALVEREDTHSGEFLIRQHNLIRDVAYDLLKVDTTAWKVSERQAARLWLEEYRPALDAPNLEKVRGYLEAFYHYCEAAYWRNAIYIAYEERLETGERLYWQLQIWSYYRELILLCNKLIEIFWKLGEHGRAGNALGALGTAYHSLGQYDRAIDFHQQHLTIAQVIGDHNGEGVALSGLGTVYNSLRQYEKAIENYQGHLTIAQERGDSEGEGCALVNLGSVYLQMGQCDRAIEFFEQSLAISEQINDDHTKSIVLGNLGGAYGNLGDHQKAIDYYQQNLIIARAMGNRESEAAALSGLGNAYLEMEQYQQAINLFGQSYDLACEIGAYGIKRIALKGLIKLGKDLIDLGDELIRVEEVQYIQPLELYRKGLMIARKIGNRNIEIRALSGIGYIYYQLEIYPKAINFYEEFLKIARELDDRGNEGRASGNLANIYRNQGQYEKAIELYQQSLSIKREVDDKQGMPLTLKNLAKLYQSLGDLYSARDHCQQALVLATELGIPLAAECQILMAELNHQA